MVPGGFIDYLALTDNELKRYDIESAKSLTLSFSEKSNIIILYINKWTFDLVNFNFMTSQINKDETTYLEIFK